ncbi:hypothetical protein CJP72_21575 [Citrobacter sp. NCU1]|uniref:hypothetical protein n=1 Tax=Citrobacter sp. NCU1 TaxID=2026683 RepID=UPI001390F1B5|nr:hypothetical protein [Citrobacter sp. NCU1]NDO83258.1 hypothetical protein [Citrobacter sp. NCU1]
MPQPITPSRYRHPQIREHLASQYLLGVLSPLARRRFESLLEQDPSLWQAVEQWQQHLDVRSPPAARPPARVWRNIKASMDKDTSTRGVKHWLRNAGWLAAGALLMFMTLTPVTQQIKPVSYLAMMSSPECRDCFVLLAFQGSKPGQSSIRVQYSEHSDPAAFTQATLWMRDKTSGQLVYLAPMTQLQDLHYLTPGEWKQLKNSAELVVKDNERTLFSGKCLTL